MAVGEGPGLHYPQGYVYTYSHGKWSTGRRLDRHTYQDTVSCASPSFCVVVDSLPQISPAGYRGGYAFTYSRGRWSGGRKIAHSISLTDVSCAATSFCAATGLSERVGGEVYTYSAGSWSHGRELGRRQYPWAISCTSRSFCLAITTPFNGTRSNYVTYSHGSWSPLHPVDTVDGGSLASVSCASARSCVAADDGGVAYVYSHGTWQPGHRIGPSDASPAVSCAASFFCVAVAGDWADVLSDMRWSGHTTVAPGDIKAVSCTKGPFCMAVGAGTHSPPGLAAWAHSNRPDRA
jgi:hypothetical protein